MKQHRRLGRAFLMAATLSAGTLTASCEMTFRDSFVSATKNTFLFATGEALTALFNPVAADLAATVDPEA